MSNFKLVVDSCCEVTKEMIGEIETAFVPFSMTVDDRTFIDDENFKPIPFIEAMKASEECAKSGCPTPFDFAKHIEPEKDTFMITISAALSACYESASMAKQQVLDEHPNAKIHIFNSRSAAPGEGLVFMKVKEGIEAGLSFEQIVEATESYIEDMQTLFVLGSLDNMVKNGRMSKISGAVASLLSIYPILYGDRGGEIGILEKCLGRKKALNKLVESVGKMGVATKDKLAYVTHCNNLDRGMEIKAKLENMYDFSKVFINENGGLGTMYANDGGIIISF